MAFALLERPQALAAALIFVAVLVVGVLLRPRKAPVLSQDWQKFTLISKTEISPNTAKYRFALPNPKDILGLPIGQHITVSALIDGKKIIRSYTPISSDEDNGFFELLIKSYPTGNVSKYFSHLKIGDTVDVKGPKGQMRYHPSLAVHIGMIAGGTGITPMLQIIRASLKNPTDATMITLIYANVNYEDILLKAELDAIAKDFPARFKIHYVLNNPPQSGWEGGVGFVSEDHIRDHFPTPSSENKIFLCGPPPMMTAMKKHLATLKYEAPRTISKVDDQVFVF